MTAPTPTQAEIEALDVSRETLADLQCYADLLVKWTRRVNLISSKSIGEIWTRHILDSKQISTIAPRTARTWVDLGSGGGLPGIVCAILAKAQSSATRFTLIESDSRKGAFLARAIADLELNAHVTVQRVEESDFPPPEVITARALAPLDQLFALVEKHTDATTTLIFPKGARHDAEISEARLRWRFSVEAFPSITSPTGRILRCALLGRT